MTVTNCSNEKQLYTQVCIQFTNDLEGFLMKIFAIISLIILSYCNLNCNKNYIVPKDFHPILSKYITVTDEWNEIDDMNFNSYSLALRFYRPFKELYKYVKEFYWNDDFVLLFGEVNEMSFLPQDSSTILKRLPGVICDFCFFVKQTDNKTRLIFTKSVNPVLVISDIELSNDIISFSNFDNLYGVRDTCRNMRRSVFYNMSLYAFLNDGYKESNFAEFWLYPFNEGNGGKCYPEQSKKLVKIMQFLTRYDLFTYNPIKY